MTATARQRIRDEVSLVERYATMFDRRLNTLINGMNDSAGGVGDRECLKLCVEAVHVILTSQNQLCRTLRELSDE